MTEPKTLQLPCVHMNGTSKESLLDALSEAYAALDDARDALRQTTPNGRDYYVLTGDAGAKAMTEHRQRQLALSNVQGELEAMMHGILASQTSATFTPTV